jgi:multidrug resistance protein, MATE family
VAINLASLAFMLPLGIGGAATTRVGNAIGRADQPGAQRSARICLVLGVGIMSLSALAFALAPGFLSRLYTPDMAVVHIAAVLVPIAAAFQIFDGLQVVSAGILRGLADTRWPAIMALFGFWGFGLPLGYFLAFRLELGPRGLWWGLTSGLASVAILLLIRVHRRFRAPIEALVE